MLAGDDGSIPSRKQVENVRRQISSWVNDEHAPSAENAAKIASVLQIPVAWLTKTSGRRSLSGALEELSQVVDEFSRHVERETEQSSDGARIVRGLDRRLAGIEELLGQLLEGQLAAAGALAELLERSDAGAEDQKDRRGGTSS